MSCFRNFWQYIILIFWRRQNDRQLCLLSFAARPSAPKPNLAGSTLSVLASHSRRVNSHHFSFITDTNCRKIPTGVFLRSKSETNRITVSLHPLYFIPYSPLNLPTTMPTSKWVKMSLTESFNSTSVLSFNFLFDQRKPNWNLFSNPKPNLPCSKLSDCQWVQCQSCCQDISSQQLTLLLITWAQRQTESPE